MVKETDVSVPVWDKDKREWIVKVKRNSKEIGEYERVFRFEAIYSFQQWYNEMVLQR